MNLEERLELLEKMLAECHAILALMAKQQATREWYSVEEFAAIAGKAPFTVREWCRLGRIRAVKKSTGRGAYPAWAISHDELLRYQREGLLPLRAA